MITECFSAKNEMFQLYCQAPKSRGQVFQFKNHKHVLQDSSPKNIPLSIFAMTRALCLWILLFSVQQSQCTDIVKLNLYYEPLCPDCQQFINQQLGPNYKRLEKYLEVRLNPYGNARKNGLYNFTCQHGPEECKAARFEGCLISKIEDHHPTVPVINCIETYDPSNPDTIKWVGVAQLIQKL